MKGFLTASVLMLAVTFATDANALVIGFTRCEIDYEITTGAFGVEVGGGEGRASCWDGARNQYKYKFDASFAIGFGAVAGICHTRGQISAAGLGFTLNEVLGFMAQAEVSSRQIGKRGIAGGIRLSTAANVSVTLNSLRFDGPFCFGLGSIQGLVTSAPVGLDERSRRALRASQSPPRHLPPRREQRYFPQEGAQSSR